MDMMDQLNAFWPIIFMVVIFYFMLWRPQKKQQKRRQEMLESLKVGAKIVTAGGLIGTIISLHQDYLVVRIADKVEVQVTRNAVTQVFGKGDKAEEKKARKAEKKVEAAKEVETPAAETTDTQQDK